VIATPAVKISLNTRIPDKKLIIQLKNSNYAGNTAAEFSG